MRNHFSVLGKQGDRLSSKIKFMGEQTLALVALRTTNLSNIQYLRYITIEPDFFSNTILGKKFKSAWIRVCSCHREEWPKPKKPTGYKETSAMDDQIFYLVLGSNFYSK